MNELIINDFIKNLKKSKKKKEYNRLDIILGIIDYINNENYKLIDNETIEQIFKYYGFAYNYYDHIGDPYDEALKLYIEYQMYEGALQNGYITDPKDKYFYLLKKCIIAMFKEEIDLYDEDSLFDKFLFELFYFEETGLINYSTLFGDDKLSNLNKEYNIIHSWFRQLDIKKQFIETYDFIKVLFINFFYIAFKREYGTTDAEINCVKNARATLAFMLSRLYGLSFMGFLLKDGNYLSHDKFLNVFNSIYTTEDSEERFNITKKYMYNLIRIFIVKFKKQRLYSKYTKNEYDFLNIDSSKIKIIINDVLMCNLFKKDKN